MAPFPENCRWWFSRAILTAETKATVANMTFCLLLRSGTMGEWRPFEKEWNNTLRKHKAKYLHTTDLMAFQDIYSGWNKPQRDLFLRDCAKVACKHSARADFGGIPGKFGLYCYVVTFVLKDFVEWAKANPGVPNNVDEACMRQSVTRIMNWSIDQADCDHCHFFFDQGEPFLGHLYQWMQNKAALRDAPYLEKISFKTEADAALTPALQLADLYAWAQSHKLIARPPIWQTKLLRSHFEWQWFDKSNLNDVDASVQDMWRSWNLPKRATTK